jgi:dTMP kinase
MPASGLFISLDGLDGTGKSTQCRLLADWLRGRGLDVVACTDPGGTALGQQLRALLLESRDAMDLRCEALLFMASRAQLVAEVIRPALAAGRCVVSDRFILANVVYQGHAGGLDPDELWRIGRFSSGGIEPDRTFVLDLPVAQTLSRRKAHADRLERRGLDYHERVRAGFRAEAERQPERIRVVDAAQSIEQVQACIRQDVESFLSSFTA